MLTTIIQLIINFLNWMFKNKKETADDIKLREDIELAEAIKKGDSDTVNAIRERRKRYPNATIMLLIMVGLLFVGCDSLRPRKIIPLASGDVAYQIPAGNYIDTKGSMHVETTNRWSLSEQDLFNKSTPKSLEPKSGSEVWKEKLIIAKDILFWLFVIICGFLIWKFIFRIIFSKADIRGG